MASDKLKIIMIGLEEDWETYDSGHRSRMISKALSESNEVDNILIIYSPLSLLRRTIERKSQKLSEKYEIITKKIFTTTYRVNEKVSLISNTSLIPESNNILYKLERLVITRRIKKIVEQSGINYNVLWIDTPRIIDILPPIASKITIFDAIDNLLIHPQLKGIKKKIKKAYKWVIENADIIFIGSEKQREMFQPNKNVKLLNNGVDRIFFDTDKITYLPFNFLEIAHPIIGYCGAIQNRLDTKLVWEIATRLPDYNFVFIGPILSNENIGILKKLKNVHFLGHKKFHQIPLYISHFDIAMIPHKVDEFTESMNPLKIYEYLACGKPVIATPVNGAAQFKEQLHIAENSEQFISCIKIAINENSEMQSEMRKKAVEKFSWDIILGDCINEIKKSITELN